MNDEIKEILVLQNYVNRYKSDEKAIINHSRLTTPLMLDYLEVKTLLDYITNLQQIEQDHQRINGELRERIAYLERSNDRREDTILGLRQEIYEQEDYKSRCEKASEITENLLKTEKSGYYQIIFKKQLNILQNGSEKDE